MDKKVYRDYLLIKELPGYKPGCIFSIGKNYIYYISYNPETKDYSTHNKDGSGFDPETHSLLRFNMHHMISNPEWFMAMDEQFLRDVKLDKLL